MFTLTMFPAGNGDCLLLSYGADTGSASHVLVDGGRTATFRRIREDLLVIGAKGEHIELLILTHIDGDHIEGLLELVRDEEVFALVDKIWFNGFDQLSDDELQSLQPLSADQADDYSKALAEKQIDLNTHFGGRAVSTDDNGDPVEVRLDGGLKLTILSPCKDQLRRLRAAWEEGRSEDPFVSVIDSTNVLEALGDDEPVLDGPDVDALAETETASDRAPYNGSSIAFLAEWDGAVVLMGADAHPSTLTRGLERLGRGDAPIDLYKVAHHGSRKNVDRELVEALNCRRFAISTDGTGKPKHPNQDAIAKLVSFGAGSLGRQVELYFNYQQGSSDVWSDASHQKRFDYTAKYPPAHRPGKLVVCVKDTEIEDI